VGLVWIFGRSHYAISYIRAAEARGFGFMVGMIAFGVLAIGAAGGILLEMFSL
jgi:hypothetical protein